MESERPGKFETRQNLDFVKQAAIFVQPDLLLWRNALQALQQFKLLDFLLHAPITGHSVMVGEGNHCQAARFCAS